jgi:chromosome segregation ATPase
VADLQLRIDQIQSDLARALERHTAGVQAAQSEIASLRASWDSERASSADTLSRGEAEARATGEAHAQSVAQFEERVKALSDRVDELTRDVEQAAAERTRLETENGVLNNQVKALQADLHQSQDFGKSIKSFLSGLGIRLPN